MATFNKFKDFTRQLCNKEHNLAADALTIALFTGAGTPIADTMSYKADLSGSGEISYTNVTNSRVLASVVLSTSGGIAKLVAADVGLLGGAAAFGPFRYIVLYNATPGSDATRGLIGWVDYGSSISVNPGETFTTDFDQVNGILTVGP